MPTSLGTMLPNLLHICGPMDPAEAATKNLRNIVKDVTEKLHVKSDELRRMAVQLKERHSSRSRARSEEHAKLLNAFEEGNRLGQGLIGKKNLLRKSLDKEEIDLLRAERENQELMNHLTELEIANKALLERRIDAEEKSKSLATKCRQLKERVESKYKEQKSANDTFKVYLGLDIARIKENMIKIIFNNLGIECYMVIDFSLKDCVSECHPELCLEKLNYAFKEKKSFYEFIKYARGQLKQRI